MDVDSPGRGLTRTSRATTFAGALRTAIEESGLGLVRIRHHVAVRGLTVSTATLSHWQTGRSVPERSTSLLVVDALEDVLGLVPGDLRSLVPGPRPRGRGAEVRESATVERLVPYWDQIVEAATELSLPLDDSVRLVSSHQVLELGRDGLPTRHVARHVLRAAADGIDRLLVYYCDESPHPTLPRIVPTIGCTADRVRHDPSVGLRVTELVLPAPLLAGERTLVEYEIEHCPVPSTSAELVLTHPAREAVIAVRFHPDAAPEAVTAQVDEHGTTTSTRVRLDPGGVATVVRHDLRPGVVGLHWTWPEVTPAP